MASDVAEHAKQLAQVYTKKAVSRLFPLVATSGSNAVQQQHAAPRTTTQLPASYAALSAASKQKLQLKLLMCITPQDTPPLQELYDSLEQQMKTIVQSILQDHASADATLPVLEEQQPQDSLFSWLSSLPGADQHKFTGLLRHLESLGHDQLWSKGIINAATASLEHLLQQHLQHPHHLWLRLQHT